MDNRAKAVILAVLVVGAIGYSWATWSKYSGGLQEEAAAERAEAGDRPGPPPEARGRGQGGRPDRGEMRERMIEELGLTAEQQAQMEKIREEIEADPNRDRGDMREAMQAILTPEQQAKSQAMRAEREVRRAQRQAQRDQEARAVMSDAEFKTYLKKREEAEARRAARGGGGPGGRGGRGGGGAR